MLIPKAKPLLVPVPKVSNWRIPEGKYHAKIKSVNKKFIEKLDGTEDAARMLFEVQVPSLPKTINLAKAEFPIDLNPGSELHNIYSRLLGKAALVDAAGGALNLKQVEDMDVEIEIEHFTTSRRDEYEYPLVKVRDIQRHGKLVPNESKEANQ